MVEHQTPSRSLEDIVKAIAEAQLTLRADVDRLQMAFAEQQRLLQEVVGELSAMIDLGCDSALASRDHSSFLDEQGINPLGLPKSATVQTGDRPDRPTTLHEAMNCAQLPEQRFRLGRGFLKPSSGTSKPWFLTLVSHPAPAVSPSAPIPVGAYGHFRRLTSIEAAPPWAKGLWPCDDKYTWAHKCKSKPQGLLFEECPEPPDPPDPDLLPPSIVRVAEVTPAIFSTLGIGTPQHRTRYSWNKEVFYKVFYDVFVACKLFNKMPERSLISWPYMISAYNQNGRNLECLMLFREFRQSAADAPNEFIWATVMQSCTHLATVENGIYIHGFVIKDGCYQNDHVGTSLINFYAKASFLDAARLVCNELGRGIVVTWIAIIMRFSINGRSNVSLDFFKEMMEIGVIPDIYAICCVLRVCSMRESLEFGRQVPDFVLRKSANVDESVRNELIELYSKCGEPKAGKIIFYQIIGNNVVSWTTMISAYMQNGFSYEADEILSQVMYFSKDASVEIQLELVVVRSGLSTFYHAKGGYQLVQWYEGGGTGEVLDDKFSYPIEVPLLGSQNDTMKSHDSSCDKVSHRRKWKSVAKLMKEIAQVKSRRRTSEAQTYGKFPAVMKRKRNEAEDEEDFNRDDLISRAHLMKRGSVEQWSIQWEGVSAQEAIWEYKQKFMRVFQTLNLEDKVALDGGSNVVNNTTRECHVTNELIGVVKGSHSVSMEQPIFIRNQALEWVM